MAKYKVCVSDSRHMDYDIEREILEAIDAELVLCNCKTEEDIIRECGDADGILLDLAPMGETAIRGLKNCKVINRYGVGYDNVNVPVCTEKGIQVTNVPDYCSEDVSDHALALLFACLRQVAERDRKVRAGQWNVPSTSFRVKGKVLGVLGFGRIAGALVRKTSGFGFSEVLVYDPYVTEEICSFMGAKKASLEEVVSKADFLSLHMPVTRETTQMLNRDMIATMKPNAIVINTARGPLIDDEALVEALRSGKILAAGLDTHCIEPLPADHPYMSMDNVVLTDHSAYNTSEAVVEVKTKAAQNIANALLGKAPVYPVNKLS